MFWLLLLVKAGLVAATAAHTAELEARVLLVAAMMPASEQKPFLVHVSGSVQQRLSGTMNSSTSMAPQEAPRPMESSSTVVGVEAFRLRA